MEALKSLKKWIIVTIVFTLLSIGVSVLCILKVEGFASWAILAYEELTSNIGVTTAAFFDKVSLPVYITTGVFFVINQILVFVYIGKSKKLASGEAKVEEKPVEKNVTKEKKKKQKIKKKVKEVVEEVVENITPDNAIKTSNNEKINAYLTKFKEQYKNKKR